MRRIIEAGSAKCQRSLWSSIAPHLTLRQHRICPVVSFASFLFVDCSSGSTSDVSRCSPLTAHAILWQSCRYCVSGFPESRFHSKLQLCRRTNAKHAFKSEWHWRLSMCCLFFLFFCESFVLAIHALSRKVPVRMTTTQQSIAYFYCLDTTSADYRYVAQRFSTKHGIMMITD